MKYLIDCGAHYGDVISNFLETEEYKKNKKFYRIFAFECDPDNLKILQEKHGDNPKVNIIPQAVWIENTILEFYQSKHKENKSFSQGSTLMKEKNTGELEKENPVIVEGIDFVSFLRKKFKKDDELLIKMDIEGAEYQVLDHMLDSNILKERFVSWFFLEFHNVKVNVPITRDEELTHQIEALGIPLMVETKEKKLKKLKTWNKMLKNKRSL